MHIIKYRKKEILKREIYNSTIIPGDFNILFSIMVRIYIYTYTQTCVLSCFCCVRLGASLLLIACQAPLSWHIYICNIYVYMAYIHMYMYIYTYAHIYTSSPNIGSSNPIPKYIPKRIDNLHKTTYTQIYVAALFITSQS